MIGFAVLVLLCALPIDIARPRLFSRSIVAFDSREVR